MIAHKLGWLFGALLFTIPLAGCVADGQDDGDGDTEEEEYGTHAENLKSGAPIFVMRHGETKDGQTITSAGKQAIEDALTEVSCDLIKNGQIVRLNSVNDPTGSKRYIATSKIVYDKLISVCPSSNVSRKYRNVRNLSSFTGTEAQDIFSAMTGNHDQTRIYILGSFLLHKLTADSDCPSGAGSSCYFKGWSGFMEKWNATRALDTCQLGQDPNDRRFMYNWMYLVPSKSCTEPYSIPLSPYSFGKCSDQWADVYDPSGCYF